MAAIASLLYAKLFVNHPLPQTDCSDQTIIVTGANCGLGLEAARHFSRLNAKRVILAVRTMSKGEDAKREIEASTQKNNVEVWELDLSSYPSVLAFGKRVEELDRLDVIIENAAIATRNFVMAEDDESTITINVVSTFLLALLVLPKLRESATKFKILPRLVIVSSGVGFSTDLPERKSESIFDALNDKDKANMMARYPVSKLMEVFTVREMTEIIAANPTKKPEVVINYLSPGLCHSALNREGNLQVKILKTLFAQSTEHGSRTLVHAATSGIESHGKYLSKCRVTDPSPFVLSEEGKQTQERVWKELSAKLEKIRPGIVKNL